MTVLVLGFVVTGAMLMVSWGQVFVGAQGDDRVTQHLAEQTIEGMRSAGFAAIATGSQTDYPAGGVGGSQTFSRTTCVIYVDKSTLGEPAGSGCTVGSATSTKRIRVTVTPTNASRADPVTIETVVSDPS